jgi:hypothetical protein
VECALTHPVDSTSSDFPGFYLEANAEPSRAPLPEPSLEAGPEPGILSDPLFVSLLCPKNPLSNLSSFNQSPPFFLTLSTLVKKLSGSSKGTILFCLWCMKST